MTDANATRGFYERMWSHYDRGLNRHERDRFAAILALVEGLRRPNRAILDAGCGLGKLAERLAAYGDVTATDWSEAGVAATRARAPSAETLVCDLVRDEIAALAGRFGLVVSSEVLEHVGRANRTTFLHNLSACLVPGGYLILTTPNRIVSQRVPPAAARDSAHCASLARPEIWHQPEDELLTVGETLALVAGSGLERLHVGSATFAEAAWERWSAFRRARSLLPRDRLGRDPIDRLLASTRLGLYTVVLARRPG